ncbi:hypothetical protein N0V90_008760 [Kalmusia sp. IMI 367209]|nr:hypothetical protein N0V90_008760 [Kalmusia sp. IMI 367209]
MQSPLYVHVKNLIALLELAEDFNIDLLHCRILICFYEMGHGLHTAAFLSLAASARAARVFGLHKKAWHTINEEQDILELEEQKRAWWAIVNLDRFMGLCHGEALLLTEDPEITDTLPIEDLLWSESSSPEELEDLVSGSPSLDTPFNITLGQMARECQISHIVGRVIRHMSNPTLDPAFNAEECAQLERTLRAYVPLLAEEELRIGKYCACVYSMCPGERGMSIVHKRYADNNSALYIIYEFKLNYSDQLSTEEKQRILECMEDVSLRCIDFAESSYVSDLEAKK